MHRNSKKQLILWFRFWMRLEAINLTRFIAYRFGKQIGFVYVVGYPKSGTTWLSQLVSHYLDIPYADPYYLPLTFKGVIHNHWSYHPALDHSIYVIRDGRDVMVSIYMNLVKNYLARSDAVKGLNKYSPVRMLVMFCGGPARRDRYFEHIFGRNFDPWEVHRNLPKFIESELSSPFIPAVRQTWQKHVTSWCEKAENTTFVKYEDMLNDGEKTLAFTLLNYLGTEVNEEEIAYTINRYSFRRQTGRQPGVEKRTSDIRKGIQGDWMNYFSREAREIFDHYAGDTLIKLGYEPDHKWVDNPQNS